MDEFDEQFQKTLDDDDVNGIIYGDFHETLSLSSQGYIGLDYSLMHSPKEGKVHLATQRAYCRNGDYYNQHTDPVIRRQCAARSQKSAFADLLDHTKIMEAVAAGCTEPYQIAEFYNLPEEFAYRACFYDRNGYLMD